MIPKYCINIFLVIVFIIILFNLKQNLNNNFKNNSNNIIDNDIIEKFDGTIKEHTIEKIDKAINETLARQIQDIYDAIKNTANDSLKNRVDTLYNDARNLYKKISDNKEVCEKEYDADYHDIIKNYQTIENQKCLKSFTDILDGKYTLPDCAKRCDDNINCLSFSHDKDKNDCRLSTICHNNNQSTIKSFNNNLYIKNKYNDENIIGDGGAYIQNYKLDKDKQCNNLCHNDIIGSSTITSNVHDCAEKCEENDSNDNKCSAFEYNFSNNECTLRKECQQGTHLINSNNYTCDKGQIKNEEILRKISFDIDRNRNLSDSVLDYYSELELKKKCNKKCDDDIECKAFTYKFTPTENNCTLYRNKKNSINISVDKNISKKFNNICIKPTNSIKKNLYTKKNSIPEKTQCEALCEENVNDNISYIKFYKDYNDINYSYISFGNMYNIKELPDFNLSEYKYIGIKYGNKISFLNNENYVSIQKVYKNPDEFNINIDELKVYIHDDNVDQNNYNEQWRSKISVILIDKLDMDCRGEMGRCKYDDTDQKYKKRFELYDSDGDLQKCRNEAIRKHGLGIANLYFPGSNSIECVNDNIDCSGYWGDCIVDEDDGKYKRTWNEVAPINGDGKCLDSLGNNIYSSGVSGCGSDANEGSNIKVNCVPNDTNRPFLISGYYKDIVGTGSGTQYYNSSGSQSLLGSSNHTTIIPDSNIVCSI